MNGKKLKWFSVRIIKQIVVEGEADASLIDQAYEDEDDNTFEESIVLYQAFHKNEVYKRAEEDIQKAEITYENSYGQSVRWELVKIIDCYEIDDEIESGVEIYSCLHTASKEMDASEFINTYFDESSDF